MSRCFEITMVALPRISGENMIVFPSVDVKGVGRSMSALLKNLPVTKVLYPAERSNTAGLGQTQ